MHSTLGSVEASATDLGSSIPMDPSHRDDHTAKEIMDHFRDELNKGLLTKLEKSTFVGAAIDESTDVSSAENAGIYVYYAEEGEAKCDFLKMKQLHGATAVHIKNAFCEVLKEFSLIEKLICFGSDGASVMLGKRGGVAAFLRADPHIWPCMLNNHCVGHRLALGAHAATDAVKYSHVVESFICSAYNPFARSSKRQDALKALQETFNESGKILRSVPTRWLSRAAVNLLYYVFST
jgi:hypothetical protein